MTDLNETNAGSGSPPVDPSAGFEPSRPSLKWILIALGFVIAGFSIANWPTVSAAAHIPQIEHALGID